MMLGYKLCLVLFLGTCTLAQQDVGSVEEPSPACFLAKRYRHFRRFVYDYEAETFNTVNGATDNKSGPKVSCTVEVDVPQTCSFILRTTDCSLSEVVGVDDEGNPLYRPAAGAEAFKAAMEKNTLKITVEGQTDVRLYPEDNEPVNILNIKRGIVSALMVPVMEEEKNNEMPTVHGVCSTDFTVNNKQDIATDVTVSRDLSRCDWFTARRQDTSPLALVSGMKYGLSKLIRSTQSCNYRFDNQKKHMTSGTCTEKHIFLPLSHENQYGISAMVKQTVTLRATAKINDRIFDHSEYEDNVRYLPMDVVDDKSPVQTMDAVAATMQKLNSLSETNEGEKRAGLFRQLVSEFRGLKGDTLNSAIVEMTDISPSLTWQALAQCGTPECTSAMLKLLRTFHEDAVEVDAVVYALGLLPNPSQQMVKDLLAMAQYKQSKPIMYALSNAARKLYKSEGVTPEITAVYNYIASLLGADCAGDKDLTFLTLRVVGNMGDAMEATDPAIKTTLLKCMRQPATTLSVQLAAIQAFRRMSVTDEVTNHIPLLHEESPCFPKRLAAYLILMRNPEDSDIEVVKKLLNQEQNEQIRAFVSSHIYNIISSTDSETKKLGEKIMDALQDTEVSTHSDYTTKSRNYELGMAHESMAAKIQGNVIFDPSSTLPREVLLETTLNAFGYSMDIWEVGMEGKGFEPTIEALFGKNGFFPDTVSKALYWAEEQMSPKIKEVLEKWVAPLKIEGQKAPENLATEIVRNLNKLVKDLQNRESPEAMAYLRLMGAELGYIKSNELKSIAENAMMYANIFMRIVPTKVMSNLISSTRNEIFAHYIFMDNKFMMSTASGLPLTFALSGTFAPGAKGGLRMTPNMELVFMPAIGIEFMTQMGIHVPEFVVSSVEMHTNMYHESSFNAKITMEQNQVKLSIPAPQGTMKFLRISNKVMIVGAGHATVIPHRLADSSCSPLFSGVKYCTKTLHGDAPGKTAAPYFPLNGETEFALDIEPTKEVSEYTASIIYGEEKDGHRKVNSVKMTLRAEGAQPTEATVTMTYNRNRNVFSTQINIPDFDVEAGVKLGMTDSNAGGKSITLEISNKNVPQLTLTGRAKLQAMTDGMLQLQLLVPSLRTDATVTATMSKADGLTMEIRSDVKLPEISSIQAVTFKYGNFAQEEWQWSSKNGHVRHSLKHCLFTTAEDVMDQRVIETDMKLRHILNKGIEASNIWMDKVSADCPYMARLRNSLAMMEMPSVPENLFMNLESTLIYQFNQDRLTITIPVPFGGKSSEELRIPQMVTTPHISMPKLGIDFASRGIQIPTFNIPSDYDLTLPLMGMVEMAAKVDTNYYKWEATASAGNNTAESPNYVAKFNIVADSPIKFLSFSAEGATKITDTEVETMEFTLDGSLKHMLITTGFNVQETIAVTDSLMSTGRYNVHAVAPVGLDTSLTITTQMTLDSKKFFGNVNTNGSVTVGPMTASTTYLYTFSVDPAKKEAIMQSSLNVKSEDLKLENKMKASYAEEELLFDSNTKVNSDPIVHNTKINLRYKDLKFTIQSSSETQADERMLRSQIDFAASRGQASLRIENLADDTSNRIYSLLTGSLNPSGMEVNTEASMNIFSSIASHKAAFSLNTNGLTTSCTTTAQHSPFTFENIFHGTVDTSTELTIGGKIATTEMRTENTNALSLTLRSFTLQSKTDNLLDSSNSYKHDITVNMGRSSASVIVKNDLKIMEVSFVNDAQFKAEPYNLELTGTVMGAFSEEELRHTYEIKFIDMVLSAKYNTNGKLLGTQMTHTTDIEVAGLTMKFNNVANFNSPSLHLDSKVATVAAPFTLNIDSIFNSNGAVNLYGKQSGELYSKFLLRAQPMFFTQSFEYRASTTHELDGRPTITTNMDNKFSSMLNLQEQSVALKVTSKVNEHAFEQEMSAYNNAERMGVEMAGAVSTLFFSESSQNYAISGFVKYDKSSDSHSLQIPFIEHLPAFIEKMKSTVVVLMDNSIEMLKDINNRYEISAKFQLKVAELKEAINNFDFNLFVQDLRKFISSMENYITNLTPKLPTEKVMNILKSIKDTIMVWMKKHDIENKFQVIYTKIEEILSSFEVEKTIGAFMDEIVKMMKQYQVREKIQRAFDALRSIDIQPVMKNIMVPVQELLNELYAFDFKQLIDDTSDYFIRMIQKVRSFDYDTLTMELKEKVAEMSKIPFISPHYKLTTTADLENTTTISDTPEFKMNLISKTTSTLRILDFTVEASAHLSVPKMSHVSISELIKVDQSSFELDHKGQMTFYGLTAEASADTIAAAKTELYSATLVNNAVFNMENGISTTVVTTYVHGINMPALNIFSEMEIKENVVFLLKDGSIQLTFNNVAREKYAIRDFSDEARHKSDLSVVMDFHKAKVSFTGTTDSNFVKTNQNVGAEICIFSHVVVDAKAETETPFIKNSVAELKFEAKVEDMKIDFSASHSAQLVGQVEGTLSNSALALVTPNELKLDTKNTANTKIALPLKLSGKIDLQNDIAFTVNTEVQQASWTGLARFNQYKYSHYFAVDNRETEINLYSQIKGDANLDVLKQPITIPEFTLPFVDMKTPKVEDYSLWEDTGLGNLLITTEQTFDMSSKLKYTKNHELIAININMDPSIKIPVMGDMTYEISMKTPMITLKTNASILKQDSIAIKLDASSTSEFEILNGMIEGNTNVNVMGGFKMASLLNVKHSMLEGHHDSTIFLTTENVAIAITNTAKVNILDLTMEIYEEITGNPEEGLIVSVSNPSAGLIAVQMQAKRPAQVKARLYGRYPSEPSTDIDILGLKMSVINSEKLNLQTTWNMEIPYEMMLGAKKQVPAVMEIVAINSLESVKSCKIVTTVTDNTVLILENYQKKVEKFLDAVVKFLRATRFQIPGYKEKLSGLEVYQKCTAFVADVSEEAIHKIPEYLSSMFATALDYFQATEFTFPGSNRIVSGKEILDDMLVALKKIQDQVVVTVRKFRDIRLEDIVKKLSAIMQFTIQQSEKLLQTLKSQNLETLSDFVSTAYNDAMNSPVMAGVIKPVEEVCRVVMEYLKAVTAKLQNILADISSKQLTADIQSWINSMVKGINTLGEISIQLIDSYNVINKSLEV
uniref:Vitellogenin domain-containing protein n=1 Tax=Astatotilapia calliptera TaxID=8154 RepID=A0AAX7VP99_ASTCA